MRIQIEEKEPCKIEVTYFADPDKVSSKRDEITNKIFDEASKVVISGYRKGKAPLQVVKLKFNKNIEEQTRQSLLVAAEEEILFETKLKTMFSTQVININLHDSQFDCKLLFFKKPSVELKQYKNLKIPKPHLPKTQLELTEQMLQELRVKYGDVVPFAEKDLVEMHDKITMNVKCFAEDKIVPDLTKNDIFYTVGQGFYHEFDDNILGMSVGEERSFNVIWDSQTKEKATFTVRIHMGVKIVPMPLDDSLAGKLGVKDFNQLRSEVEGAAINKIKEFEQNSIHGQIIAQLMALHQIEIPHWLLLMDAQQLALQHNLKWNEIPEDSRKTLENKALERLKLTLIMDAIREIEPDIQFSNNEILDIVKNRMTQQGQDAEKFIVELQRTGKLFGVVAALQQEATLEWLAKNTEIIE